MTPMDAVWLVLVKTYSLCPPLSGFPLSHPVGVLLILATPVKSYLKWWEIQLAIHPIVGG